MDNEMMTKIQELVEQHLPAQLSESLRRALNQAEADRLLVQSLTRDLEASRNQNKSLTEQVRANGEIEEKRREIAEAQRVLDAKKVDAKIVELREEHATRRVEDMKGVVLAVFANSKLKYNSYSNEQIPNPQYGGTISKSSGGEREV